MKNKTYFNWSTGKDSALALYYLQQNPEFKVDLLLTSINTQLDRISMHGLRRSLLEQQVQSIGIPLETIELPEVVDMETYNSILSKKMELLRSKGYTHAGFGDIFLEDLRQYRETKLNELNIQALFPLWKKSSTELMEEFLALGFKTIVVCINETVLDKSFVGRIIDEQFLKDLPENVDPCGENGEFHTFCFDGPIFSNPIAFDLGERVRKCYPSPLNQSEIGYWFCDLIPKNEMNFS